MKLHKNMFLTILLLSFVAFNSFGAALSLQEAIKSKKIVCKINGNSGSTHYLDPLIIEITNLSNENVSVSWQDGDLFIPDDPSMQNIVATQPELISLLPKATKTAKIKGMCTEHHDKSGSPTTTYTFQPGNNESLKKLAKFISEKKYQTSAAQYAVWSLMDNDDLNSIFSADSTEERQLKDFMASLTGKTYTISKDYKYSYYAPPREKVGGNFEYNFSKPQDVQIAMFDKNGILVRELFNKKKVPPGEHKLSFEFDASVYTDDVYYFKLIAMNEVLISREWNVKAIRDAFKKKVEDRMNGGN